MQPFKALYKRQCTERRRLQLTEVPVRDGVHRSARLDLGFKRSGSLGRPRCPTSDITTVQPVSRL